MKSKKYRRERAAPIEDLKNILADVGKSPKWFFENYCLTDPNMFSFYADYQEFLEDLNREEYFSACIKSGYERLKKDLKFT